MLSAPFITVGVPVYQGELYIEETLQSIQDQTHKNIEVMISVDGVQSEVEEKCQSFLKDSRFRLFVQPERLGWVDNINWLMRQVETPYWYCHAQDDLIDQRYIEVLLAHAQQAPEAAVVYCDIVAFGLQNQNIVQKSLAGDPTSRQLKLLYEHFNAVAFRGLTRVEALHHSGNIRANNVNSFATDTVWMAAMARWGQLLRVPYKMYHKRYHATNEHAKWATWPAEKITKAWITHCAGMLEQAMRVETTTQERRLLWQAAVTRLNSPRFNYISNAGLDTKKHGILLDEFFKHLQTTRQVDIPTLLEGNWQNIYKWTKGFFMHKKPFPYKHYLSSVLRKIKKMT